jgi:RNA polymerase sigma factor (sigma-70 family)
MGWVSFSPTPLRGDSENPDDRRIRQVVDLYLRRHPPIPGHDVEDLYQEGRLAWFRAKDTYRADRGASLPTYIGRVVEYRLSDLARAAGAVRRRPSRELSLDAPTGEDGDPLIDLLRDDAPSPDVEVEHSDLLERLSRVRGRLPRRQQGIFDALFDEADRSRTGLAREFGVSRDTLYEDMRRIRQVCRDDGLEDFLR